MPRSPPPDLDAQVQGDVGEGVEPVIPLLLTRVVDSRSPAAGGKRVTVHGEGFLPAATVRFGGIEATAVLTLDDREINCDVPPHAAGLVDVEVILSDGRRALLLAGYLYQSELALHSIEPTLGPSRGGVDVMVRGRDFLPSATVLVGGRLLRNQEVLDGETIVGKLPARLSTRPGKVEVIVSQGVEQRILEDAFRYIDDVDVLRIRPVAGPLNGGTTVRLQGRGLDRETLVRFQGVMAEILEPGDGFQILVRTPPGTLGIADIEIEGATATQVLTGAWRYLADAPPAQIGSLTIDHAWPATGPAGGGTVVTLSVSGLPFSEPGLVNATVGELPATVLEVDPLSNTLLVRTAIGTVGPAEVAVGTGGPKASATGLFAFDHTPRVESITPGEASTAGGDIVLVEGVDLRDDLLFRFGEALGQVVEVTEEGLSVMVPPGLPGIVDLRVHAGDLEIHVPNALSYQSPGPPRLLGVAPPRGAQSGGRIVRLYGEGFTDQEPLLSEVSFGPSEAHAPVVVDDGTMAVRSPRAEPGSATVNMGAAGMIAMAYETFDPTAYYGGTAGGPIPEALNITVLDGVSGKPVEQAYVILWDNIETLYQGLTDDRGQLTLSDRGFSPQQMVTAAKDLYTTSSVVDFDARDVTLRIFPLVPAEPGGGPPVVPDPPVLATITGEVSGYAKYVLPPPGSCDAKIEDDLDDPILCQPCKEDTDCVVHPDEGGGETEAETPSGADTPGSGPTYSCVIVGDQGGRCSTGCETTEDCPEGFLCSGLGFGNVACIPSPGARTAWCGTSQPDIFSYDDDSLALDGFTNGSDTYETTSDPGEHAVVCLGGYMDPDTGEFIPMMMGVRRHIFVQEGQKLEGQNVRLDIPLSRTLRLRLDGAPVGDGEARNHRVVVYLDLASDGVFLMPNQGEGVDQNLFELDGFPTVFEESLYDASFIVFGSALTDEAAQELSNDATFALHTDLRSIEDDVVYRVTSEGAHVTSTGISHDVAHMHGPGTGRVWAVGAGGRVLVWDGAWWALQQTPVPADLHGVWARTDQDVWAVGDEGAVLRWNGIVWLEAEVPEELSAVSWRAVHGQNGRVFFLGDDGIWTLEGDTWSQLAPGEVTAGLRGIWSEDETTLWAVGDGGAMMRWDADGLIDLSVGGADLLGIDGAHGEEIWAVGRSGRMLRYTGQDFFEYLPKTRADLHAVHAVDASRVWAAGDGGAVVMWDGDVLTALDGARDVDLRAIRSVSPGGAVTGGRHTLIIGPFLQIPFGINPTETGGLASLEMEWGVGDGVSEDFTYTMLAESNGLPFWLMMVGPDRHSVPLPDLEAAWGIPAISMWAGPGFLRLIRVRMPGFDIDHYDGTDLNTMRWRAWATRDVPVEWPVDIMP